MLFLIKNGYKGVPKRPQEDIVFIVCNYEAVKQAGLSFLFTDRNAKMTLANFFTNEQDFAKLKWEVIKDKDWENTNSQLDKRDLKQAEFLIRNFVPVNCIHALVVKTKERKDYFDQIIANLGLSIQVFIDNQSKLYY